MRTRLRLATLVALAASIVPFAAIPAHAQKPALTQNIDEMGRNPYSATLTSAIGAPLTFPVVPSGFRLVITHVSAIFDTVSEPYGYLNGTLYSVLGVDDEFLPAPVAIPKSQPNDSLVAWVINTPETFYVDAGHSPQIVVQGLISNLSVSIHGYLVNLSQ